MKARDISGQRFGRLVAICFSGKKNRRNFWKFRCDCGKEVEINISSVLCGRSTSCGCFHDEVTGSLNKSHGESKTRLYQCWRDMKVRCLLKTSKNWRNYGGRGISVCEERLNSYESFRDWSVENGYSDNLTLDRVDVNGNYCPENCRWTDRSVQNRNRRTTVFISLNGETKTEREWLSAIGYKSTSSFSYYKNSGYSNEEILQILMENKNGKRKRKNSLRPTL